MNPSASSFQLNTFNPPVPNWQAPGYGGGPPPHPQLTYRQPEEDDVDKTDSLSYHNESRDSSNTVGEFQRQQQHLSSVASHYSAHHNYPIKAYEGDKVPPSTFAMPFNQSHLFVQQQHQNPLYSRTGGSFGQSAPFNDNNINKSRFGSALNAPAVSNDSSVFKHDSKVYAVEGANFDEIPSSVCGDRGLGYGSINTNYDLGPYHPYLLAGTQTHQQHGRPQFPPPGGSFYGQGHYSDFTASFENDEFSNSMGQVGYKVSLDAASSSITSIRSDATHNSVPETRGANVKCPWGRYGSMQVVQEDMGLVSEGSTEASSSVFSSTDVPGGFWHTGSKSIQPTHASATCIIRGRDATDLITADFSGRHDPSVPVHPHLNSRSLSESTSASVGGGKVQPFQQKFPNSGTPGQFLLSSPSFPSLGVQNCESQSSLQTAVMEDRAETTSNVVAKEQLISSGQTSQFSEAPLPPLMPLENLSSHSGSYLKVKHQTDSTVAKNQNKKDFTATSEISVANVKKSNRPNKVPKGQKPGTNKLNRKSSSDASSSPSSMVTPFRGSTSSLAIAASMLPSFSSFGLTDPDDDSSSLRLIDDSSLSNIPMSNDSAKQKYSLRSDVDRPILPSACSGKKFYPHSPILSDAQTGAPTSTYAAFYEDGSQSFDFSELEYEGNAFDDSSLGLPPSSFSVPSNAVKKRDWLLRMNRKLKETDVGTLDPSRIPIHAVMNAWAKTKSNEGAQMVEMWLRRVEKEVELGNTLVEIGTKMYTMAVDAWAKR
jgi:hypothetical protein